MEDEQVVGGKENSQASCLLSWVDFGADIFTLIKKHHRWANLGG